MSVKGAHPAEAELKTERREERGSGLKFPDCFRTRMSYAVFIDWTGGPESDPLDRRLAREKAARSGESRLHLGGEIGERGERVICLCAS